jgi:type IV secretory pathway VirB2 component (pilin)
MVPLARVISGVLRRVLRRQQARRNAMHRISEMSLKLVVPVLSLASQVYAGGSGMPWEVPVQTVSTSIIGTYGPYATAIAFIGGLLAWGFGGQHSESLLKPVFHYGSIAAMIGGAVGFVALMGAPAGMTLR